MSEIVIVLLSRNFKSKLPCTNFIAGKKYFCFFRWYGHPEEYFQMWCIWYTWRWPLTQSHPCFWTGLTTPPIGMRVQEKNGYFNYGGHTGSGVRLQRFKTVPKKDFFQHQPWKVMESTQKWIKKHLVRPLLDTWFTGWPTLQNNMWLVEMNSICFLVG